MLIGKQKAPGPGAFFCLQKIRANRLYLLTRFRLREPESIPDQVRDRLSLENALIQRRIAWAIAARFVFHENFRDLRMPDRLARLVRQQILLGNVGDVFRF
jgi:hypothetical protein